MPLSPCVYLPLAELLTIMTGSHGKSLSHSRLLHENGDSDRGNRYQCHADGFFGGRSLHGTEYNMHGSMRRADFWCDHIVLVPVTTSVATLPTSPPIHDAKMKWPHFTVSALTLLELSPEDPDHVASRKLSWVAEYPT